jgi:hypothetical protein
MAIAREGSILTLKHLVQLGLSVILLITLVSLLSTCSLSQESSTNIQNVWEYYNDPSQQENITVALDSGEGIIFYGKDFFEYRHAGMTANTMKRYAHVRGLYSERPSSSICVDDQTCICQCGELNLTDMNSEDTGKFLGISREDAPKVEDGKLQCLKATCRSHPAPVQGAQGAEGVFGEAYPGYEQQVFRESFLILNDKDITSPAATVNQKLFTVAGYTDEINTQKQTIKIQTDSEDEDAERRFCFEAACQK